VPVGLERRLQATRDRRSDAGGRALDELAHALELLKGDLAVDAEFVRDLVHAWVGHKYSCLGSAQAGRTLAEGAHFELLI
jgi:hypothetical protein